MGLFSLHTTFNEHVVPPVISPWFEEDMLQQPGVFALPLCVSGCFIMEARAGLGHNFINLIKDYSFLFPGMIKCHFLLCQCILARWRDPRASPPGTGTKGSPAWAGCAAADKTSAENGLSFAYKRRLNERSESRAASLCVSQGERSRSSVNVTTNGFPLPLLLIPLYGLAVRKLRMEIPYNHQLPRYLHRLNCRRSARSGCSWRNSSWKIVAAPSITQQSSRASVAVVRSERKLIFFWKQFLNTNSRQG